MTSDLNIPEYIIISPNLVHVLRHILHESAHEKGYRRIYYIYQAARQVGDVHLPDGWVGG